MGGGHSLLASHDSPGTWEHATPPRSDGFPRTMMALPVFQLHHSFSIKSTFHGECLYQAGPDASETCNYSWLPTPHSLCTCVSSRHQLAISCLLLPLKRVGWGAGEISLKPKHTLLASSSKTQKRNKNFKLANLIPSPNRSCQRKQTNINWLESPSFKPKLLKTQ